MTVPNVKIEGNYMKQNTFWLALQSKNLSCHQSTSCYQIQGLIFTKYVLFLLQDGSKTLQIPGSFGAAKLKMGKKNIGN